MNNYLNEIKNLMSQADSLSATTATQIIACLTFTAICAAVIYLVYRNFYRGACYSENFAVLLVMVTLITAMIILTISSSVALSLGTIGALSIIRFRSAIKDPLDVGFLFWAVVAGLTTGAGMVPFALIGSFFLAFVYIAMTFLRTGSGTYLLVVHYDEAAEQPVADVLASCKAKLKNKTRHSNTTELTVQLRVKKGNTEFMDRLNAISGVSNCILVEFTGE